MAPLVRPLLPLAALLATATTQFTAAPAQIAQTWLSTPSLEIIPFNCGKHEFGIITDNTVPLSPIYIPHDKNDTNASLVVLDACPTYDPENKYERVGELIIACNNDKRGPAPWVHVPRPHKDGLKYVKWGCVDKCSEGTIIIIVEYCEPVLPKHTRFPHPPYISVDDYPFQ